VCEFFPQLFRDGSYYGKTLGVDEFTFEGSIRDGDQVYEEMRSDAFSPAPLGQAYFEKVGGEQEQVVEIYQSIRANQARAFFANLPNGGQVPNLPPGAIVETPALTGGMGIRPILQQPLPTAVAGSLATRYAWVDCVVEAALEASRDKFIQALILDGGVQSTDHAVALADDFLQAHQAYLPGFST
jgi:alpha-galactosidase